MSGVFYIGSPSGPGHDLLDHRLNNLLDGIATSKLIAVAHLNLIDHQTYQLGP